MDVLAADTSSSHLSSEADSAPPVGILRRSIVWLLIVGAIAVTLYGLARFDWQGRQRWPEDELRSVLLTLSLPAVVLFGGAWWKHWPILCVLVFAGGLLLTYGPAAMATMAFCGIAFVSIGALVFRIRLDRLESLLLAGVVGFGLAGVIVGVTAPLRVHFDFTYGAAFGLCIFLARRQLAGIFVQAWQRLKQPLQGNFGSRLIHNSGVASAVLLSIALMLYATMRESGYDGLVTHFYLTESLRQDGQFVFDIAASPFVLMPKTAVWGLATVDVIGGEYAMRAAHASLLGISAALVGMRSTPFMGRGGAGILVATLLSAPVAFWISSHFFEETGTLALLTASAVFFLRGVERDGSPLADVAGLACLGMAVSSKPQALFMGLLGVAFVLRRLATMRSVQGLLVAVSSSLVFLLMAAGPYARAYLTTGNPFFPFVPGEMLDPRWERPLSAAVPYDMVFATSNHMEAYPGGFAFQFLLLLACGVSAILLLRPKSVSALAVAGLVFAVALAGQTLYARYQIYAFPFYMLACATVYSSLGRAGRAMLVGSLVLVTPLNLQFWPSMHVADFSLAHLTSPELNSVVPPERRAFDALNDLYGDKTSVYVAGSAFSAGLAGTPHALSSEARALDAASNLQDVARILRDARITHVVASQPVRNPLVLEACKLICNEFPLGAADYKIFSVDWARASILADRLNALELLGANTPSDVDGNVPATIELGEGWSNREEWGWWSVAPTAEIRLGEGFTGAKLIHAKVQAFSPPGTVGLEVVATLDDAEVARWTFESGSLGQVVEKTIELQQPIAPGASRVLRFRFSKTYMPKDYLGGEDSRELALGLISLTR